MRTPDRMAGAYAAFMDKWPDYAATAHLDVLRAREYTRLDAGTDADNHVYLDYTGGSLYALSQLRAHAALLEQGIYGNPHSGNLTSSAATTLVERVRRRVLEWFNAPPGEYTAIFTANATAGLKLVGEAYPFAPGSRLLLTFDNHNSVNGIREFAASKGATVTYAPLTLPNLRIDREALTGLLGGPDKVRPTGIDEVRPSGGARKLFAFPAQSNFSGVQHPLDLVAEAHSYGWDVLLDAAAYVPTNRLDVAAVRPDFVAVSFYKMFGFPTGVGCLLVRQETLTRLGRPWFAGGTVNFASVHAQAHVLAAREAGFEDGTLDYLNIPAVEIGLDHLETVGLESIRTRVHCLTGWILRQLFELTHANGRHMVRIYGPATLEARGATVTFNLYDPDGHLLDYRRVEELATAERISLRTGCFCNPGAGETAEGVTDEDVEIAMAGGGEMTMPRFLEVVEHRGGRSVGAIRVSLGIASNFADAWRFVEFVTGFRDQTRLTIGEVTFDIESCRVIRDGS